MSRHRPHPVLLTFLAFASFLSVAPARAELASQEISKAVIESAEKQSQEDQANFDRVIKSLEAATERRKDVEIKLQKVLDRRAMTPADDSSILTTYLAVPNAMALTSVIASSALDSRYRELNLIKQNTSSPLARGLVDSTTGSLANDPASFEVFKDYFCDPRSYDGEMSKLEGCAAKRYSVLGNPGTDLDATTDVAIKNNQMAGLPLKPQLLFLEPLTLPSLPDDKAVAVPGDNTNKLADLVFGAYRYFERLVLGKAVNKLGQYDLATTGGRSVYVANQGKIARQMLASYPFAMLFAERKGTLGADPSGAPGSNSQAAPQAAAALLRKSWGSATIDSYVLSLIETLEKQKTMSMAQFKDILMYKMLMSPGYMTRINQLSPEQLKREKVFLMSLQTVIKYETNHWMEISTAIEAVRK